MLVGLQDAPKLRVVVDHRLENFGGDLTPRPVSVSVWVLAGQDPALDLLHQVLHARGKSDGRVLVDPNRDPGVYHPPEKTPDGEGEATAGRFAFPQAVPCAHAIQRKSFDGGQDATLRQGPTLDQLDGALDLEAGALGVHHAQALSLPGDPDQRPPEEHRQPPGGFGAEASSLGDLFPFPQDLLHVFLAPREFLEVGQFGAFGEDVGHFGILRQDGVDGIPAVVAAVHGARVVPPVAPGLRRSQGLAVGLAGREAEGPAGVPCPIPGVQG